MRLAGLATYVQTHHDDHEDVVGQGFIDLVHDQELVISETRLAIDLGLTKRFGVSLVFPFRVVSTSIRYVDTNGMEVDLVTEGIHHRNETESGLADPIFLGSAAGKLGGFRGAVRAGFSIPIGRTERNPFAPERIDQPHQHIQMGSGTVQPVLSAELTRRRGRWHAGGFVLTQQALYENTKGYHAGDRYAGGITVRRRLGEAWGVRAGVEVQGETAGHSKANPPIAARYKSHLPGQVEKSSRHISSSNWSASAGRVLHKTVVKVSIRILPHH